MCCTDDSAVLKTRPLEISEEDTSCRLEIEGDGYNGNVSLIALDIFQGIVETLLFYETGLGSLWEMNTWNEDLTNEQPITPRRDGQAPQMLLSQLLA